MNFTMFKWRIILFYSIQGGGGGGVIPTLGKGGGGGGGAVSIFLSLRGE